MQSITGMSTAHTMEPLSARTWTRCGNVSTGDYQNVIDANMCATWDASRTLLYRSYVHISAGAPAVPGRVHLEYTLLAGGAAFGLVDSAMMQLWPLIDPAAAVHVSDLAAIVGADAVVHVLGVSLLFNDYQRQVLLPVGADTGVDADSTAVYAWVTWMDSGAHHGVIVDITAHVHGQFAGHKCVGPTGGGWALRECIAWQHGHKLVLWHLRRHHRWLIDPPPTMPLSEATRTWARWECQRDFVVAPLLNRSRRCYAWFTVAVMSDGPVGDLEPFVACGCAIGMTRAVGWHGDINECEHGRSSMTADCIVRFLFRT